MSDLSLDNIVTNDMNFKHLETTKDIIVSIKNESGFPQRPDATHTWTAKVSDGTNYVGDYAVKINQTSLIVDSENFTKLPVGSYQLEVWEEWTDPNGTKQRSIYPSPSQTIPFTIYANITDQAEKEIKSIGFQGVVDQAVMNIGMNYVFKVNMIEPDQTATVVQSAADGKNYVTFNIPQGPKGDQGNIGPAPTLKIGTVTKLNPDQTPTANFSGDNGAYTLDLGIPQGSKGDTGAVDNTGLISAPAFQSLQTQVDNSAVGTNLFINTSISATSRKTTMPGASAIINGLYSRTDSYEQVTTPTPDELYYRFVNPDPKNLYGLTPGETYTISGSGSHTSGKLEFRSQYGVNGSWSNLSTLFDLGIPISDGSVFAPFSYTFTIPVIATGIFFSLQNYNFTDGSLFRFKNMKLEKGSVSTPWCPNPAEILTQGDYAKIKAAIVALGGSLS